MNIKKLKSIVTYKKLLFVFLIILAFLYRFYDLEKRTSFGADQEYIFYKASELLKGDPVLLGMPTSVGGFSIGPFFTYLWTFFSFVFSGNPVAGSYLSIVLGIVTIIAFFISGKAVFKSYQDAFLISIIYSFSYLIYVWDISP